MSRSQFFRTCVVAPICVFALAVNCGGIALAQNPANPSFSGTTDENTLLHIFPGTYRVGGPGATLNFSVFNFPAPSGSTSRMSFDGFTAIGEEDAIENMQLNTGSLVNLPAGSSSPMSLTLATINPSPPGGQSSVLFTLRFKSVDLPGQPNTTELAIAAYATVLRRGDYDSDGDVDNTDYGIWRSTVGTTGTNLAADGNQNNVIDAADYAIWRNDFTGPFGAGGGDESVRSIAAFAAPEPSSAAMLVLAGALAAHGRVRKRRPPHVHGA
jgi:hypothetical protein